MRFVLPIAVTAAVSACGSFLPTPHWNPTTREVDCSVSRPLKYTAVTLALALVGVGSLHDANHPQPVMYDQYGYPTDPLAPGPDVNRGLGYALLGLSGIGAAVSALEWATYGRCERLDTRLQSLVATPDCATVVRLAGELASIDPRFRDAVVASDARIASCLAVPDADPPVEPVVLPSIDPVVNQLTEAARGFAHDADCAAVGTIAARVRNADPGFYARVFVVDPAIATCALH